MREYFQNSFTASTDDGLKRFTEIQNNIDKVITTESGVTVIPVSRVTMCYASGGAGFGDAKCSQDKNFGGGGGVGISVTPLAFLIVGKNADVNLITLDERESTVEKIMDITKNAPEIINNIKKTFK